MFSQFVTSGYFKRERNSLMLTREFLNLKSLIVCLASCHVEGRRDWLD